MATIRQEFNGEVADLFLKDLQYGRSKYYYFLGGVEPWSGIGNEDEDDNAPTDSIVESCQVSRNLRSEIAFVKQIVANDASLVIPKITWTSGAYYDQWDHTVDMLDKEFYVVTSENRVYKCLNNYHGAASTYEPDLISIDPITMDDGYVWKYMYTISPFKQRRFGSGTWIPVQRALSDSFYNNGSIEDVVVSDSGDGYSSDTLTTLTVSGTTAGTGAQISVSVSETGAISSVTIMDGGSGYTKGAGTIYDGAGIGAVLTPVFTSGVLTDVTIEDGGYNYSEGELIDFGPIDAELLALVSGGEIVGVYTVEPGIGYDGDPSIIVDDSGMGATGKYDGNTTAIIQAVEVDGAIDYVYIEDPGEGYVGNEDTTIVVSGDGEDASFLPVISNGQLVDVVIIDKGVGYSEITLTVYSGSGTGEGAVLTALIASSDYESDQAIVEQAPTIGGIYAIEMNTHGSDYGSTTTVTITGNGSGCTAVPVITSNGEITRITITNPGEGYTYANVTIVDPEWLDDARSEDQLASAYAILPPENGHGLDAPKELLCDSVSIVTPMPLQSELEVENIEQDYRYYGILKNPKSILTGRTFAAQSSLCAIKTIFTDISELEKDYILVSESNNRYRVLEVNTSGGENFVYLIPLDDISSSPVGTMTLLDSTTTYVCESIDTNIDFNKYSGELIYVSLEDPFTFSDENSLTIKTFIRF